ncbi:MAG: ankyrin repeat domain-containing protein [Bacteroidota bacterium]
MSGGDWKEMLYAAENGDLELVKYHVKMGVDINYQHPELLTTALIESTRYGREAVVKFLLEKGADPAAKAVMGGETALDVAKVYQHKAIAKLIQSFLS